MLKMVSSFFLCVCVCVCVCVNVIVCMYVNRSRELVSHLKGHHLPITGIAIYQDDLHAISVSLDRYG